ncbi:acyl carrier protein-like protein [Lipomyces orientalis]|uniref:Acyl carrier protein-like protein n=1 Tax=Lipomyces orientalis TaxID=1233043 RepID=A0ACC3TGK0_9ASCO
MLRSQLLRHVRAASRLTAPVSARQFSSVSRVAVSRPLAACAVLRPHTLVQQRFYSADAGLSRDEVTSRIIEVVKAFDKITSPEKITPSATFANDLGLDSLDAVEVVMAIEEEFSIEIPDKEADEIKSIGQAIDYILAQSDAV